MMEKLWGGRGGLCIAALFSHQVNQRWQLKREGMRSTSHYLSYHTIASNHPAHEAPANNDDDSNESNNDNNEIIIKDNNDTNTDNNDNVIWVILWWNDSNYDSFPHILDLIEIYLKKAVLRIQVRTNDRPPEMIFIFPVR